MAEGFQLSIRAHQLHAHEQTSLACTGNVESSEAARLLTLDARSDTLFAELADELPSILRDSLYALHRLHVYRIADAQLWDPDSA